MPGPPDWLARESNVEFAKKLGRIFGCAGLPSPEVFVDLNKVHYNNLATSRFGAVRREFEA